MLMTSLKTTVFVALFLLMNSDSSFGQLRKKIVQVHRKTGAYGREDTWSYYDSAIYSSDGKYLATAKSATGLTIWDGRQEKMLSTASLYLTTESARPIAFDPANPHVAVSIRGEDSYEITTIDLHDRSKRKVIGKGWPPIIYSPDGKYLAVSASDRYSDRAVIVYEISGNSEPRYLDLELQQVETTDMEFSPDGTILAVAVTNTAKDSLMLFDTKSWRRIASSKRLVNSTTRIRFAPDGKRLYSIDKRSDKLVVWSVPQLKVLHTIANFKDGDFSISSDGNVLVSFSRTYDVATVWHSHSRTRIGKLNGQDFRAITFSPDDESIVSVSGIPGLWLWEWKKLTSIRKPRLTLKTFRKDYSSQIRISPDGKRIAVLAEDDIRLLDAQSGRFVATFSSNDHKDASDGSGYCNFIFFGKAPYLACSQRADLAIWDVQTRKLKSLLKRDSGSLYQIAVAADGTALALKYNDRIEVISLKTGKKLQVIAGESFRAGLAITPDNSQLIVGKKVYNMQTGEEVYSIDSDYAGWRIQFTQDGKQAVRGGGGGVACVWDIESGDIRPIGLHDDRIVGIALFHNDKVVATSSEDKTIRLWELASGRLLVTLKGHEATVNSIDVSPDDQMLASASEDGTVRLWDVGDFAMATNNDVVAKDNTPLLPTSKIFRTSNGAEIRISFDHVVSDAELRDAVVELLQGLEN